MRWAINQLLLLARNRDTAGLIEADVGPVPVANPATSELMHVRDAPITLHAHQGETWKVDVDLPKKGLERRKLVLVFEKPFTMLEAKKPIRVRSQATLIFLAADRLLLIQREHARQCHRDGFLG